jgi:Kef-type K+ transport system membrane component KefB
MTLLPSPNRGLVVAIGLTTGAVAILVTAYAVGWLRPEHVGAAHSASTGAQSPAQLVWRLLLAVAVVCALATVCARLAAWVGQPPVVGEIVAGLVLGPSVLGSLAPWLFHAVFSAQVLPHLNLLAQAGLAIFMFRVGTEIDQRVLRRQRGAIAAASLSTMVVPFALGVLAALPLYPMLAGPSADKVPFVMFIGTALSVTAFPVLARIVQDCGLRGSRLGALAMLCAAVTDVLAWCALAVVLAMNRSEGFGGALAALVLTVVLGVGCLLMLRPMLQWLAARYAGRDVPTPILGLLVLGLIFGLAAVTDQIGVHAIFGGFLAGLMLPKDIAPLRQVTEQIVTVNRALLVPLFFTSIGLQTDMRAVIDQPLMLAGGALLMLTAILGKVGSATPVASAGGLPIRSSLGLGVLMNARGITEIVVLDAGLSVGIINRSAFTVMVVIALLTTLMAAPALRLLGPTLQDQATTPHGVRISMGTIGP